MSDIMQRPQPSPVQPSPQPGPARPGGDAISRNSSVFNPADLAMKQQMGEIRPDMTVRQFIEGTLKVPMDAPVTQLTVALKNQVRNKDAMGKIKSIAGQAAPAGGAPPMGGSPAPQGGGGLEALMSQLKG